MNDIVDITIPASKKAPKINTQRLQRIEDAAKAYLHEQDAGTSLAAERAARKELVEALKE